MNIIHISVSGPPILYQYGGAIQRRILEIAREQAKGGNYVCIYSIGDPGKSKEIDGIKVIYVHCASSAPWRSFEFQIKAVESLRRERMDLDVIHFHSQPEGAFLAGKLGSKKFLSYDYYHFRMGRRTPIYFIYRYFLNRFDLLLPVSRYCLEGSRRYWKIQPEKFRIVYNGVSLSQFRPDVRLQEEERARLGVKKRVVLYVGRVCHQKGTDILSDAFRILNEKREDLQLLIAGPIDRFGPYSNGKVWADRISRVGGIYLGPVEEARLAAIYNLADIFVMPTRKMEMFGMAAIEAQACGKAVVAGDHGGLRETVPEACGGRFPVGKADKLAETIEMLIDDRDRYVQCGLNAIKNASKYAWNNICTRLYEIYSLRIS